MKTKPNIRLARSVDLKKIVEIYNQAIHSRSATGDMDKFKVNERVSWFNKFDEFNFPIFVLEIKEIVVGYATLSPYRCGRRAMNKIAEVSFYVDYSYHNKGVATSLLNHVIIESNKLGKVSLIAILLDINTKSVELLKKFQFEEWGHLPNIIDFEGNKCGHLIYGLKLKTKHNNGKSWQK